MTALSNINNNQTVFIKQINSGRRLNCYLNSIGIFPNAKIYVLNNYFNGPILLKINNSTISLGCGIAEKIYVDKSLD